MNPSRDSPSPTPQKHGLESDSNHWPDSSTNYCHRHEYVESASRRMMAYVLSSIEFHIGIYFRPRLEVAYHKVLMNTLQVSVCYKTPNKTIYESW